MSSSRSSNGKAVEERFACVVLHDVAPATRTACLRLLRAVHQVAELPVTLLAVPRYHGDTSTREFEGWLGQRSRRGDELALHGWTHRDESEPAGLFDRLRRRHYTRSEGEFWALSEVEARRRIGAGVDWFREHGWPLAGFVAPAWLLGPGAWAALATERFEYTATLRQLVHLPSRQRVTSQSVVYSTSSAWRRNSSVLWNGAVARIERGNPLLRIELHPRDADFAAVLLSWQRILERALRDRRATTVADFMRQARGTATGAPSTLFPATRQL